MMYTRIYVPSPRSHRFPMHGVGAIERDLVPGWLLALGATIALGVAITRPSVRRNVPATRAPWTALEGQIKGAQASAFGLGPAARRTHGALGKAYDAYLSDFLEAR